MSNTNEKNTWIGRQFARDEKSFHASVSISVDKVWHVLGFTISKSIKSSRHLVEGPQFQDGGGKGGWSGLRLSQFLSTDPILVCSANDTALLYVALYDILFEKLQLFSHHMKDRFRIFDQKLPDF